MGRPSSFTDDDVERAVDRLLEGNVVPSWRGIRVVLGGGSPDRILASLRKCLDRRHPQGHPLILEAISNLHTPLTSAPVRRWDAKTAERLVNVLLETAAGIESLPTEQVKKTYQPAARILSRLRRRLAAIIGE